MTSSESEEINENNLVVVWTRHQKMWMERVKNELN